MSGPRTQSKREGHDIQSCRKTQPNIFALQRLGGRLCLGARELPQRLKPHVVLDLNRHEWAKNTKQTGRARHSVVPQNATKHIRASAPGGAPLFGCSRITPEAEAPCRARLESA